jgi:hypothetical protein
MGRQTPLPLAVKHFKPPRTTRGRWAARAREFQTSEFGLGSFETSRKFPEIYYESSPAHTQIPYENSDFRQETCLENYFHTILLEEVPEFPSRELEVLVAVSRNFRKSSLRELRG